MADNEGNGFGGLLGNVLKDAADIGKVYLQGQQKPAPAAKPAAAPKTNWLPWVIGGAVGLVVLVLVFSMTGRRK